MGGSLYVGGKAPDIPAGPSRIYADSGWAGWSDWLGTGRWGGDFQFFEDARAFVQGLKLKSKTEGADYCKSGEKPSDIPTKPSAVYTDSGWAGWSDWPDTGRQSYTHGGWRSFADARAFVRGLKAKSHKEWRAYRKSEERPRDIPAAPDQVYANAGWAGWNDWLGNGRQKLQ